MIDAKVARILNNKTDIINLINKDLNNNDYLMIKGSNSTGLHNIATNLKQRTSHVIWIIIKLYWDFYLFKCF